jgi:ribosomal protein S21
MHVKVKNNNIEIALRILKRKFKESGKQLDLRERERHEKPSIKKNKAKAAAVLREKRRQK